MTTISAQACDLLIAAGFVVRWSRRDSAGRPAVAVRAAKSWRSCPSPRRGFDSRRTRWSRDNRPDPRPGQRPRTQPHDPAAGVATTCRSRSGCRNHLAIEAAVIGPDFVADGVTRPSPKCLRGGTPAATRLFLPISGRHLQAHGFRARVGLPVMIFPPPGPARTQSISSRGGGSRPMRDDRPHACFRAARSLHGVGCQFRTHPHAGRPTGPASAPASARDRAGIAQSQKSLPAPDRPPGRLACQDRLIAVHMTQLTGRDPSLRRARCSVGALSPIQPQPARFCPVCARNGQGSIGDRHDGVASNNDLTVRRNPYGRPAGQGRGRRAADRCLPRVARSHPGRGQAGFDHWSLHRAGRRRPVCVDLSALKTQPLTMSFRSLSTRPVASMSAICGLRKAQAATRELVDRTAGIIANARQWRARISACALIRLHKDPCMIVPPLTPLTFRHPNWTNRRVANRGGTRKARRSRCTRSIVRLDYVSSESAWPAQACWMSVAAPACSARLWRAKARR